MFGASTPPSTPAPTAWPLTLVINTCAAYAPTTVPMLLESLGAAGVPPEAIRIVCGQSSDKPPAIPLVDEMGISVVHTEYTAEAMTGLVYLSEHHDLVDTPWVLYLQDTMAVGPDFPYKALMVCDSVSVEQVDCVRLLDMFSLSVGLYSTAWLQGLDLSEYKRQARTTRDVQQIKTWSEDRVFGLCAPERARHLAEYQNPTDRVVMGDFRYSDASTPRIIEHYPVLDVYKLKSWMGGAPDTDIPVGV